MSDCEEADLFLESRISLGGKKREKNSIKDTKKPQNKNNIHLKTGDNIQKKKKKKKKNSKLKEAVEGWKAKKKEKKKKKNKVGPDDNFLLTQASNVQEEPAVNSRSGDRLKQDHMTQDSKKKCKRKKKVAFDLSPGYICVKRPKFDSSSPQCPNESTVSENEAVRDSESCSQITVTGHSRGPAQENDSECNSEDINSQDLFITQKTFRVSQSEPSSIEAITATPQMFTQPDEQDTPVVQLKEYLDSSYKSSQESHFHQHHGKTNEHTKKKEKVTHKEKEGEEEQLNEAHHKHNKDHLSFQTQMELNANLTEEELCPAHKKPTVVNPYLAEPVVVKCSLDVEKSKRHSCTSSQQSVRSTSTQTENLFTSKLSLYLNFCQKSRVTTHCEDMKALDLSLPWRARKELGTSVKTAPLQGDNHKDLKHPQVKKEASGEHLRSVNTQDKGETAQSPQSESEPKSADTTTSSEDSEPRCRRLDLTQVRAVQTRLNESFFFKTKGEGQSPRPESPLMKLAQGRDMKSRKSH
ncbi:uncharacterized protein LOC119024906 isoform X3 [Acanthopagrus latus]|nr:uncharacterized protein LOC119024906 isoform X3 [Acanthopagrus latus]